MAAIITDDFRKNNIERFIDDVSSNQSPNSTAVNYYIGIGKTDPWDRDVNGRTEAETGFLVPLPDGSILEKADIKKNLMLKDLAISLQRKLLTTTVANSYFKKPNQQSQPIIVLRP